MLVEYKYKDRNLNNDLVCELTRFFDCYLTGCSNLFKTYLYNDIATYSESENYVIPFRVPGATRGGLRLLKISPGVYCIKSIDFNYDTCFGEYGCYLESLRLDSKVYEGQILDFRKVKLIGEK